MMLGLWTQLSHESAVSTICFTHLDLHQCLSLDTLKRLWMPLSCMSSHRMLPNSLVGQKCIGGNGPNGRFGRIGPETVENGSSANKRDQGSCERGPTTSLKTPNPRNIQTLVSTPIIPHMLTREECCRFLPTVSAMWSSMHQPPSVCDSFLPQVRTRMLPGTGFAQVEFEYSASPYVVEVLAKATPELKVGGVCDPRVLSIPF